MIGGIGGGDDLQRSWFTEERLGIAARCGGAMWRLLDETVAWTTAREQGGARVFDHQGVSFPLADSAADAAAGRLLTFTVAELADAGADPKLVHHKASMAKLFTSEAACRCADRCVQAFGGRGYLRSNVGRAAPARAARRPHLGGHERDPAADRRPRAGAPWGRANPSLKEHTCRLLRSRPGRTGRGDATGSDAAAAPRSVAVVGANDRPGLLRGHRLRNLARAGFEGPVYGRQPEAHGGPRPPVRADRRRPARARRRGRRRDPRGRGAAGRSARSRAAAAAVRSSSPPASARSSPGASSRPSCARRRSSAGLPVCGPNGNGVVAVGARAPLWGDSVPAARARAGGDGLAERQRRRQRDRLASRDRLPHARLDRQPGRARRQRLARRRWPSRWRRLGRAVPRVRRRRRRARGGACGLRRARDRRRRAQGRLLGRRARARRRRTPAPSPATSASSAPWSRRPGGAWAADPHELLELARALAEPRARPRGPGVAVLDLLGRRLRARRRRGRARRASSCPSSRRRRRSRSPSCFPRRRRSRNPLDYTSLIWARDRSAAPNRAQRSATTPRSTCCCSVTTTRAGSPPSTSASGRRCARASPRGRSSRGAAALFASTLPDLLDERRGARARRSAGFPRSPGCAPRSRARRRCARPGGDPARLREIAEAAAAALGGRSRTRTAGSARPRRSGSSRRRRGGARGRRGVGSRRLPGRSPEAVGWPVALKLSGPGDPAQGGGRGARSRTRATRRSCARRSTGSSTLPEAHAG